MSWLFNSFQSNDPDSAHQHHQSHAPASPEQSPSPRNRDLSVITHSIGRQLRGVAAFLEPPPSSPTAAEIDDSSDSVSSQGLIGIRNDLAEIGGSFKSLLSSNKAVTEISRFASSLLQFQDDDAERILGNDGGGVPGINGEVLDFVKEISAVPACWTDFPLSLDNDFNMSDTQREHALAMEHLVPSLETLRVKLLSSISDEQFWMIYFILLLPRLNEHDIELLSTPKIAETRDALLQELQNRKHAKLEVDNSEKSKMPDTSRDDSETRGENGPSREDMVTAEVENGAKGIQIEEATEQWLGETDADRNTSVGAQRILEHEEDTSFSDLEDDDNDLSGRLSSLGSVQGTGASSPRGSNEWVQLNESRGLRKESESDGSNGWLTVDDFD